MAEPIEFLIFFFFGHHVFVHSCKENGKKKKPGKGIGLP